MQCADSLRVQAYFDSELDAASSYEIERHLEHCAGCSALLNDLRSVRDGLRGHLTVERAPQDLRARVTLALDRDDARAAHHGVSRLLGWRRAPFWAGAFSGLGAAAACAMVAWFLMMPPSSGTLIDSLVGAHVRSLQPDHLVAVVSTDRHTVKPWFAGHADVSPVVADFKAQGYPLIGGRSEHIDRQRAAVVVYRHGLHTINVFGWASDGRAMSERITRNGYHLAFWKVGNLQYCAVSDTGWTELDGLVALLRDLAIGEDHPAKE
ncbi:MAG TPA: zf-HC2 domain-containing protein [Steroidobacteraceae bacterium]|nr:zf-HC2 domain-containing protein [Steroidobacteraceae bacterium]